MYGMTGYSFNEQYYDDIYISTEIRSVNHRFLELNVNLPYYLANMEMEIKQLVQSRLSRGKVDITVHIKVQDSVDNITINEEVAKMYKNALTDLAFKLDLEPNITISDILRNDDVLTTNKKQDYRQYWDKISASLTKNLDDVIAMRTTEGIETEKDILNNLNIIEQNVAVLDKNQFLMEENILKTTKEKIGQLIGDNVDENRLLTEVGLLVNRACINEEINRLKLHIAKAKEVIDSDIDVGKRIDFLCQEMHREINTTGAKIVDAVFTDNVIIIKNAIEKIREQIRNIE